MIVSGRDTVQWWVILPENWLVEVLLFTENIGLMFITRGGPFGEFKARGHAVTFSAGTGYANDTDRAAWLATAEALIAA